MGRRESVARRMDLRLVWDDLVLPAPETATLRAIAAQLKSRRGPGISALFVGPAGTGKTLAAEILARDLNRDLRRIDLSSVVSAYIGETEKSLRAVFEAAAQSGAILLFDEADALFGQRSDVKDSHDRYATIEGNFLLQQMEAYRGLAILTSRLTTALDPAFDAAFDPVFLGRLSFVVQFPFPGPAERLRLWSKAFPAAVPTAGLDFARLAHLELAGGSIRSIALGAAFLAADAGEPVRMSHLREASWIEYAKLERDLPAGEREAWR